MKPHQENPLAGDDARPPEQQFYSLGFLCGMLQQPPHFIQNLARMAEVQPSYVVNGIPHFRGDDVQKMAAVLQAARDQCEQIEQYQNN
jgi:hypothetical protein